MGAPVAASMSCAERADRAEARVGPTVGRRLVDQLAQRHVEQRLAARV